MNSESSIKVAVRARPMSKQEIDNGCQSCVCFPNDMESDIIIGGKKQFSFDFSFSDEKTQQELYEKSVRDIIQNLFLGYNVTVLAYGQTGSGKTYSMGTNCNNTNISEQTGIIPRAINDIFKYLEEISNSNSINVTVSFIEVYKEKIYDLLSHMKEVRQIREENSTIKIPDLIEKKVLNTEDVFRILTKGAENRAVGSTAMNETSSRSHAIFSIQISITPVADEGPLFSKLHLVDLAGSEKADKTGATGDRFKEGVNINQGLSVLGNVISSLVEREKNKGKTIHIPYRDSKLTRLLQDSLGGNTKTLMVACISPSDSNFNETKGTLEYAARARQIKNRPVMNKGDTSQGEVNQLRAQVAALTAQLRRFENGDIYKIGTTDTVPVASNVTHQYLNQIYKKDMEIACLQQSKLGMIKYYEEDISKRESYMSWLFEKVKENEANVDLFEQLKNEYEKSFPAENIDKDETIDDMDNSIETVECAKTQELNILKEDLESNISNLKKNLNELEVIKEYEEKKREYDKKILELEEKKRNQKRKSLNDYEDSLADLRRKVGKFENIKKEKDRKNEEVNKLKKNILDLKSCIIKVEKDMQKERKQYRKELADSKKQCAQMVQKDRKRQGEMDRLADKHAKETAALKQRYERTSINEKKLKELLNNKKTTSKGLTRKSSKNIGGQMKQWIRQCLDQAGEQMETRQRYQQMLDDRSRLTVEMRTLPFDPSSERARRETLDQLNRYIADIQEIQLGHSGDSGNQHDASFSGSSEYDMQVNSYWTQMRSLAEAKIAIKVLFAHLIAERKRYVLVDLQLQDSRFDVDTLGQRIENLNSELEQSRLLRETELKRNSTLRSAITKDTSFVRSRKSGLLNMDACRCQKGCIESRCGCLKSNGKCTSDCACGGFSSCRNQTKLLKIAEISEDKENCAPNRRKTFNLYKESNEEESQAHSTNVQNCKRISYVKGKFFEPISNNTEQD